MAFNFPFKKYSSGIDLILDINSSSIGISFSSPDKDGGINILYTKRYPITFKDNIDAKKFVDKSLKTLDTALLETATTAISSISEISKPSEIKNIHIMFASPWYISKVRQIEVKKEKTFTLTKENFEKLIKKEAETGTTGADMEIVEKNINQVILNGYEMSDPFNKEANAIKISFYIGQVGKKNLEQINSLVGKHFSKGDVSYHTHASIFFHTIRDKFLHLNNYAYFDIGGETTEIAIIQKGTLTGLASTPYGKNDLIRNISNSCKTDFDTTFSSLKMMSKDQLDNKCENDILALFKKEEINWTNSIKEALENITGISELPQKLCLISDDKFIPIAEKLTLGEHFQKEIYKEGEQSNIFSLDLTTKSKIRYNDGVKKDLFLETGSLYVLLKDSK